MENIRKENYEIIDVYNRYEKQLATDEPELEVVYLPAIDNKDKENLPELWKKIHLTAIKCDDTDKFSEWLLMIVNTLPCDCKWHALHYIQTNSPTDLIPTLSDTDINIAFVWSWEFHNSVNIRLGKPEFPYEEALSYYESII